MQNNLQTTRFYVPKPKTNMVQAWQWPDGGVTQLAISKEIEEAGVQLGLYDGCVEHGDYSDGSKWRWRSATLKNGRYECAEVGDWIVIDDGDSFVMNTEKFKDKYRGV